MSTKRLDIKMQVTNPKKLFLFHNKSLISSSNTSCFVGFGASTGFSTTFLTGILLNNFITIKIQKAIIKKSIIAWRKLP